MLQDSEIEMLRTSKLVASESRMEAAQTFYETLFETAPDLRDMFPQKTDDQARKFAATLVVAVSSLHNWNALRPIIGALARRHLAYGVTEEHYDRVGDALIETLDRLDASSDECAAWVKVYAALANYMKCTAYPSREQKQTASSFD